MREVYALTLVHCNGWVHNLIEVWDLWYPKGASTDVPFARGRLDATDVLLVHAPPEFLTVEVRTDDGRRLAYGTDLLRTGDYPMARLTRRGEKIEREDGWPTPKGTKPPAKARRLPC